MVGKNTVDLALPKEYARLHPVFNVALVMPVQDTTAPLTLDLHSETLHRQVDDSITRDIARWISVGVILDHQLVNSDHQYLLRPESTGINDA